MFLLFSLIACEIVEIRNFRTEKYFSGNPVLNSPIHAGSPSKLHSYVMMQNPTQKTFSWQLSNALALTISEDKRLIYMPWAKLASQSFHLDHINNAYYHIMHEGKCLAYLQHSDTYMLKPCTDKKALAEFEIVIGTKGGVLADYIIDKDLNTETPIAKLEPSDKQRPPTNPPALPK